MSSRKPHSAAAPVRGPRKLRKTHWKYHFFLISLSSQHVRKPLHVLSFGRQQGSQAKGDEKADTQKIPESDCPLGKPLPEDRNLESREDGTRVPGKEEDIQGT